MLVEKFHAFFAVARNLDLEADAQKIACHYLLVHKIICNK